VPKVKCEMSLNHNLFIIVGDKIILQVQWNIVEIPREHLLNFL